MPCGRYPVVSLPVIPRTRLVFRTFEINVELQGPMRNSYVSFITLRSPSIIPAQAGGESPFQGISIFNLGLSPAYCVD